MIFLSEDARVRIFHGDELVLSLTPEGAQPDLNLSP